MPMSYDNLDISDREVYTALRAALESLIDSGEVNTYSLSDYLLSVRKAHRSGYITMDDLIDIYTLAGKYID